jgi:type II secretion system protein N
MNMSRRMQISLYSLFGAFAFFAALVLTFPYDAVGRRLESEVAKAVPGSTLLIREFGPAFPLGVKLSEITYTAPAKDGQTASTLNIDKLRVTPAWLKLLTFKPGVAFSVAAFGGEATGQAVIGKSSQQFEAKIDAAHAVKLDSGQQLEKMLGVQLQGLLSGSVKLAVDAKGVVQTGSIDANLSDARIVGGKVASFTLPATDLGSPEVEIAIDKGEAKINKLRTKGSDIEASVTGTVALKPELAQSQIRGNAKVKLLESYLARNPSLRAVTGFVPQNMKKPDGAIELPLNGPLNRAVSFPGLGGGRF